MCEQGPSFWNDFVQVDDKIHTEIAHIAGNPLYTFVLQSVHENIHRYYNKFLEVGATEMEENYKDLAQIVAAVISKDPATASRMAVQHVRRFSSYMEKKKHREPKL